MKFQVGFNSKLENSGRKDFTFIFNKIAVGKSFCFPKKKSEDMNTFLECP